MLCEYWHTKSESLTQIRTTVAKIQHFFIGAPCISVGGRPTCN